MGNYGKGVLSVFDWSVEVVEQYIEEVRPLYGSEGDPALWLTERGVHLSESQVWRLFTGKPERLKPAHADGDLPDPRLHP